MALKMPSESSSCSPGWEQNWYRRFGLWVKKVDKQTELTVGSRIRENVPLRFPLLEEWISQLTMMKNKAIGTKRDIALPWCQQIGQETKLGSVRKESWFYSSTSVFTQLAFKNIVSF